MRPFRSHLSRGSALLAVAVLACAGSGRAASAQAPYVPVQPPPPPSKEDVLRSKELYRAILGGASAGSAQDTVGRGQYAEARGLFEAGNFDTAAVRFQRFASRFPRNPLVNEALEHVLLIRENREPGDEQLKIYARAVAVREAGLADSAAALAQVR